jgi:predicted dehydrogenase
MFAYEVVGSKGSLRLDPAYELASELTHHLTIDGKKKTRNFSRRDQFAPELIYFSNCIQKNLDPQPSGEEGLADVRIIEALYRSADSGAAVEIDSAPPRKRSTRAQEIKRPPIQMPRMVNATGPSPE